MAKREPALLEDRPSYSPDLSARSAGVPASDHVFCVKIFLEAGEKVPAFADGSIAEVNYLKSLGAYSFHVTSCQLLFLADYISYLQEMRRLVLSFDVVPPGGIRSSSGTPTLIPLNLVSGFTAESMSDDATYRPNAQSLGEPSVELGDFNYSKPETFQAPAWATEWY